MVRRVDADLPCRVGPDGEQRHAAHVLAVGPVRAPNSAAASTHASRVPAEELDRRDRPVVRGVRLSRPSPLPSRGPAFSSGAANVTDGGWPRQPSWPVASGIRWPVCRGLRQESALLRHAIAVAVGLARVGADLVFAPRRRGRHRRRRAVADVGGPVRRRGRHRCRRTAARCRRRPSPSRRRTRPKRWPCRTASPTRATDCAAASMSGSVAGVIDPSVVENPTKIAPSGIRVAGRGRAVGVARQVGGDPRRLATDLDRRGRCAGPEHEPRVDVGRAADRVAVGSAGPSLQPHQLFVGVERSRAVVRRPAVRVVDDPVEVGHGAGLGFRRRWSRWRCRCRSRGSCCRRSGVPVTTPLRKTPRVPPAAAR